MVDLPEEIDTLLNVICPCSNGAVITSWYPAFIFCCRYDECPFASIGVCKLQYSLLRPVLRELEFSRCSIQ